MYPDVDNVEETVDSFPRTRGDVPYKDEDLSMRQRFPPHTRGCTA